MPEKRTNVNSPNVGDGLAHPETHKKTGRLNRRKSKMKQIALILVILIGVISIGNLAQKHLINTSTELNNKLEELKKELDNLISIAPDKENMEKSKKAEELSREIHKKWEELNKTWSIIVMHEELDQITLSILGVKSCVEIGDLETGREELEKTIFLVDHIKEKEAFKFKNIF